MPSTMPEDGSDIFGRAAYGKTTPADVTSAVATEIEKVNSIITKYFPVYDIRLGRSALIFRCKISESTLDEKFIALKDELFKISYVPMLTQENQEYLLLVVRKPPARYRSVSVNAILLLLTIITTVFAGAWAYAMFDGQITLQSDIMKTLSIYLNPHYILMGALTFAFPLMFILGVHELGHYFMSRRHGVSASLPFFMPIPPYPISPLGTLGAFISVREPIPNKKALLDIGIAGPICGFLVALPVTLLGLFLTGYYHLPASSDVRDFFLPGDSMFYFGLSSLFHGISGYALHPTAFAGWVGMLVTAINLLPAGQLDGGHIAHALFGRNARWFSYGAVGVMLVLGLFSPSWFLFAFLIILLGLRHPPPLNDLTRLDARRKVLGVFAIALLIVCFVPAPLTVQEASFNYSLTRFQGEVMNKTVPVNGTGWFNYVTVDFNFTVKNTGNTKENFTLSVQVPPMQFPPWDYRLHPLDQYTNNSQIKFDLRVSESMNFTVTVYVPDNSSFANKTYRVMIKVQETESEGAKELYFNVQVVKGPVIFSQCFKNTEMPCKRPVDSQVIYLAKIEAITRETRHP